MEKQDAMLAISVEEMGRRINLSRDVAYKLAHSQGFPSVHVGGRIVIPVRELEEWLAAQSMKDRSNGQTV